MSSMMGSFALDKTVGVSNKRRDSLPTGGKKPTNLKTNGDVGSSGLSRSSSSRSTTEDARRRGRAPSRTELLMTPATQQTQTPSPNPPSTFISLPTSSSSFAYSNQPPTSSLQPPPLPSASPTFQSTQSYPPPTSLNPQQSSFNFTHPPESISSSNNISLSIEDIFQLANPSRPPPASSSLNQSSNTINYESTSRSTSASNEAPLEDILRGLNAGGSSSTLDFADLGFNGWPTEFGDTDFGGGENSNFPDGGAGNGGSAAISFDELLANSGMTGIEPSSLDSNATLRPHLPAGGSSFTTSTTTPSSVFSSSESPEEFKQQAWGTYPQNDRVRRLSKAGEPFLGRDEVGTGVGTGFRAWSGGEDAAGMGRSGEAGSHPKLSEVGSPLCFSLALRLLPFI